jgi:hypothetical protein
MVAGGVVLLLVTIAAGCGNVLDPKQQAVDTATRAVRANARQARVEVEATLRDPGTGQERPVDRAARVLEEQISKGIGGRSSARRLAPTGPSTWRGPSSSTARVAGSSPEGSLCCCASA